MRIPDRLARLLRGRAEDPAWARPSLLAATALLYLWSLSASGWANDFYSAAAQAASQSWKAFFFGSSDASNFITVDKPPAALWVMGLSARLFGVNSWSLLAPRRCRSCPRSRLSTWPRPPGRSAAGWARMFGAEVGGQVAWLLPAALVLLAAGLWLTRRAPRTNRARAAFALWGGWLVVTGVVFSFMQGIFHAYYAVALAPAVGALVGMGATGLWEVRRNLVTRWWLAGTVAVTAVWSWVRLRRTPDWHPELAPLVLLGGLAVAALIATVTRGWRPRSGPTRPPGSSWATGEPVMAIGGFNGSDPTPPWSSSSSSWPRAGSTTSSAGAAWGPVDGRQRRGPGGRRLGGGELHRHQRRRGRRLRPHGRMTLTTSPGASPSAAGSPRWSPSPAGPRPGGGSRCGRWR